MPTLTRISRTLGSRRMLTSVSAVLFGAALLGTTAGAAQASAAQAATTLPTSEVHIPANAGPLLSLKAGPSNNGNASVFHAFEDPTQPTPDNMRFIAFAAGNNTYYLCSKSVSQSMGPFGLACLDVISKSLLPGTALKIAPFDATSSQQWVIENKDPVRPQTLTLRNVHSGLYVDTGEDPKSGQRPTQRPFKQGASQQWFIKPARQ